MPPRARCPQLGPSLPTAPHLAASPPPHVPSPPVCGSEHILGGQGVVDRAPRGPDNQPGGHARARLWKGLERSPAGGQPVGNYDPSRPRVSSQQKGRRAAEPSGRGPCRPGGAVRLRPQPGLAPGERGSHPGRSCSPPGAKQAGGGEPGTPAGRADPAGLLLLRRPQCLAAPNPSLAPRPPHSRPGHGRAAGGPPQPHSPQPLSSPQPPDPAPGSTSGGSAGLGLGWHCLRPLRPGARAWSKAPMPHCPPRSLLTKPWEECRGRRGHRVREDTGQGPAARG